MIAAIFTAAIALSFFSPHAHASAVNPNPNALAPAHHHLSVAFPPRPAAAVLEELAAAARDLNPTDVYGEGEWLSAFQARVAADFGKEAALFFTTGVASQLAALSAHNAAAADGYGGGMRPMLKPSFIAHATSHLLLHEEAAAEAMLGFKPLIAGAAHRPLAAADVEVDLRRLAAVGCRPACILLEVPHRELGCETLNFDELVAIKRLAEQYDVPLHLDAARLLEVQPYLNRTLAEIGATCDSLFISFYKGLGAMTGAMLLGSSGFIKESKKWRRRLGGNPLTSMPYALSCSAAYDKHTGSFTARWRKLEGLAPKLSAAAAANGGSLRFVPETPQCCQAHCYLRGAAAQLDAARDKVLADTGVSLYSRLRGVDVGPQKDECYVEITIGPGHLEVPDEVFVDAWQSFFAALGTLAPPTRT